MAASFAASRRMPLAATAIVLGIALLTARAGSAGTVCEPGGGGTPVPSASPAPTPTIPLGVLGGTAASREQAASTGTCDAAVGLDVAPAGGGVWGTTFGLSGSLSCNGNLLGGKQVTLQKLSGGSWTAVSSGPTDDSGYTFTQKPSHSGTYRVAFAGDELCSPAESPAKTVIVRPGVAFNAASGATSRRGGTAIFSGSVLPAHPGHVVTLQVLQSGAWRNAVTVKLDSQSRYRLAYTRASGSGPLLFRVAYPTQHADHGWNVSRSIRVTWS
ncbi:MAG TPA: hypothetical protein VM841_13020 [Actinomycetota bacterium]|nr:hypothetical protein [Actinomycetota bacterium]